MLNFDDVNEYFEFLCKHQLTPEQFAFMYTLLLDEKDDTDRYKQAANIYKFSERVRYWNFEEIKDLEQRGLIINYNPKEGVGEASSPDMYEVSDKFKKLVYESPSKLGKELWDAYPKKIVVDGKYVRGKTCDYDELIAKYHKAIQGSPKKHKKVLEALQFSIERGEITMGIWKYVASRMWEDTLEEMKEYQKRVGKQETFL